jgi:hypothetical protein
MMRKKGHEDHARGGGEGRHIGKVTQSSDCSVLKVSKTPNEREDLLVCQQQAFLRTHVPSLDKTRCHYLDTSGNSKSTKNFYFSANFEFQTWSGWSS